VREIKEISCRALSWTDPSALFRDLLMFSHLNYSECLLGGEGKEDALNAQKLGASDENKRDIR
jgi:hypothetical protein